MPRILGDSVDPSRFPDRQTAVVSLTLEVRWCWLLLVPFLMLATISQGTMIEAAPAGGVRIVLCTGTGMVDAIMTPDGQVHPDDQPGRGGHPGTPPCDWALHGQSVLASPAVDMVPPRFRELDADFGTDIPSIVAGPRF